MEHFLESREFFSVGSGRIRINFVNIGRFRAIIAKLLLIVAIFVSCLQFCFNIGSVRSHIAIHVLQFAHNVVFLVHERFIGVFLARPLDSSH